MPVVTAGMHIKKATCLARCLFSWVLHFSVNDGKEGVGRATPESNISRTAICQPQVAANDAEISRRFSRPSSSNGPDEGRGDDSSSEMHSALSRFAYQVRMLWMKSGGVGEPSDQVRMS